MDNVSQEKMEKLIMEAPLEKQDKDFLMELFHDKGEAAGFYEKFNELLIKGLKKRELACTDVMVKFDSEEKAIHNRYLKKKDQLEKELAVKLNDTDIFQIQERNKIMDDYYQQLDGISKDYENEIKKLGTQLLVSLL